MLKSVVKKSMFLCSLLPVSIGDNDKVPKDSKTTSFYNEVKEGETGWERLYTMFSIDEFGAVTPELNSVYQASFLGMFTGACVGGFIRSRSAYLTFMESNQATTFKSHLEAKKTLQDFVTVNFAKGAFQWGWRLGLFSGSYVLVTTALSVYRGRSSLLEYAVAGGLTGAAYKMSMGLRGAAVGALVGVVFGSIAGGASLAVLHISGTSMEEVRFWQQGWKQARKRQEQHAYKRAREAKEDPLVKHHDAIVGTTGKHLDSLDIPRGT